MSTRRLWTVAALGAGLAGTAGAGDLTLVNGDRLSGPIIEQTADTVVIDHAALGRLEIARDRIDQLALSNDERVSLGMVQDESADPPAEATKTPWKTSLRIGLGASYGNTDDQSLNAGIKSVRKNDRIRTALELGYFYGASDGDRTENRLLASVKNDWYVPESRWFYFAQGRYDYDEFQEWEHRLAVHGGVGYQLIQKDDFTFDLRGGAGVTREWNRDATRPELLAGWDLTWDITDAQALTASSTIYFDLDETGEFRTVTSAEYSAKIGDQSNLAFNAGVLHEYQSDVTDPTDKNDVRIFAGIQWDF